MFTNNCQSGEHIHCGGQLKFADPADDTLDVSFPCECICHKPPTGKITGSSVQEAAKDAGEVRLFVLKHLHNMGDRIPQFIEEKKYMDARALMFIMAKLGVEFKE